MALKDKIAFGMSLPHRSPDPIDMGAVKTVAQRANKRTRRARNGTIVSSHSCCLFSLGS